MGRETGRRGLERSARAPHPTPRLHQSVIGYAHAPDVLARIFLGYLLYDLAAMAAFYADLNDASAIVHHLLFAPCAAYVLAHSIMAFPFVWLSFCEVSTPFVNLRWHLAATDRKNNPLYMWNAAAVAALFFLSRIVFYGGGLVHLYSVADVWGDARLPLGHKVCVALFALGYVLNLYWMAAIAKAARRALARGGEGARRARPPLLPLWEKVAEPPGLAFGKPEDRRREVG